MLYIEYTPNSDTLNIPVEYEEFSSIADLMLRREEEKEKFRQLTPIGTYDGKPVYNTESFIKALKQVYNPETLKVNPEVIVGRHLNIERILDRDRLLVVRQNLKRFIEEIPSEDRWLLAFVEIHINNGTHFVNFYKRVNPDEIRSGGVIYLNEVQHLVQRYSGRNLFEYFDRIKEALSSTENIRLMGLSNQMLAQTFLYSMVGASERGSLESHFVKFRHNNQYLWDFQTRVRAILNTETPLEPRFYDKFMLSIFYPLGEPQDYVPEGLRNLPWFKQVDLFFLCSWWSDPANLSNIVGPDRLIIMVCPETIETVPNDPYDSIKRATSQVFNYSAAPSRYFTTAIRMGERYFGVELEVSTDYKPAELVRAQKEPFFILKSDASITGSRQYSYEICTKPMPMREHKKKWTELFQNLNLQKFDTSVRTTNGMHIHVSKEHFDPMALHRLCWLFANPFNYYPFFLLSSRNNQKSIAQYAAFAPDNHSGKLKERVFSAVDRVKSGRGALNISSKNTVEFRLFKGLVSFAEIIKNIEVVAALCDYVMEERSITKIDFLDFVSFVEDAPSNRYKTLRLCLKEIPLERVKESNEVLTKLGKLPGSISYATAHDHLNLFSKEEKLILNKTLGIIAGGKKIEVEEGDFQNFQHLDEELMKMYMRQTPSTRS